MKEPEEHKVFNNSTAARKNALAALAKAKELEAKQLKQGAKWKRYDKIARLEPPKKPSGHTSILKANNTDTF